MKWNIVAGNLLVLLVCAGTIWELRYGDTVGAYAGTVVCLVVWGLWIADWRGKLK